MLKMQISVTVESVNASKNGAKHAGYVDLLFVGGTANLPVNEEQLKLLKDHVGDNIICEFQMSPVGIIDYGRPACAFKIKNLLKVMPGQGGK